MGKSNIGKTDRELPAGERRVGNLCEYLPEFRTQQMICLSRLRRCGVRYKAEVICYKSQSLAEAENVSSQQI